MTIRQLGWAVIQNCWCSNKKGKFGYRETGRISHEERGRDYSNKSVSQRIPRITVSHGAKRQAWDEFFFRASRRTNAANILFQTSGLQKE